jgi:[protein-PII] uridylyltransferase
LLTHWEKDVKWHEELEHLSKVAGVAVDLRKVEGGFLATVVTGDRQNLFASLAGTLSAFGMNIVKAEAFANTRGLILDTFVFEDPMRTLELNPPEVDRLKLNLQRAALGKEDVRRLLKGRVRPAVAGKPRIQTSVTVDNEASGHATLIELITEDRPGLLYDVAEAISSAGYGIDVVLIDTEAHKALDVFYVTCNGQKLPAEALEPLRAKLLEASA